MKNLKLAQSMLIHDKDGHVNCGIIDRQEVGYSMKTFGVQSYHINNSKMYGIYHVALCWSNPSGFIQPILQLYANPTTFFIS